MNNLKSTLPIPVNEVTTVVFRRWHNGDVVALFPLEPQDVNGIYSGSYEKVGQHGAADAEGLISRTSPAKPEEYAELKRELERIGYTLEVKMHIPRRSLEVRQRKAGVWKNAA